jgi:futalosine hydrolase
VAPAVGATGLVVQDALADEGVATPTGFLSLAELGLGSATSLHADEGLVARAVAALGDVPPWRGATVSTCSGTDALAEALRARTGADVETMEGAAIAWVCRDHGVPWVQVRAISNRTGDREHAGWDLDRATGAVRVAVRRLWEAGV